MSNAVAESPVRRRPRNRVVISNESVAPVPDSRAGGLRSNTSITAYGEVPFLLRVIETVIDRTAEPPPLIAGDEEVVTVSRPGKTAAFLCELYRLEAEVSDRAASLHATRHLNRLVNSGNYTACGDILVRIDVSRVSPATLISLLGITLPIKKRVPGREAFLQRVELPLVASEGQTAARRIINRFA